LFLLIRTTPVLLSDEVASRSQGFESGLSKAAITMERLDLLRPEGQMAWYQDPKEFLVPGILRPGILIQRLFASGSALKAHQHGS
jgi:hypothetical protein